MALDTWNIRIVSTAHNGIRIVGNTSAAVRAGVYTLLREYGVRWYFKHSSWHITPSAMANIGIFSRKYTPSFTYRYPDHESQYDKAELISWVKRNRMIGPTIYFTSHNYYYIASTAVYWATNPEWYTGDPPAGNWQLDPAQSSLIARGIEYAQDWLNTNGGLYDMSSSYVFDEDLIRGGPSFTPRDMTAWDPPYDDALTSEVDQQSITNLVHYFASIVADGIQSTHPGKYTNVSNYNIHSGVPNITQSPFNNNPISPYLIVRITDGYNISARSDKERYEDIKALGCEVGTYQYLAEWAICKEQPLSRKDYNRLRHVEYYNDAGAKVYTCHCMDGWGGYGLLMWLMAEMTWDAGLASSANYEWLLQDFYTNCFGTAAGEHMRNVFENIDEDNYSMNYIFDELVEAETDAGADADILSRIRQIICWAYFTWKYHNLDYTTLSDADLEAFFTMCSKLRQWYTVYYKYVCNSTAFGLRKELLAREYASTAIDALADTANVPTTTEIATWKQEAIDYFDGLAATAITEHINPTLYNTTALADTANAAVDPMGSGTRVYLVPSDGAETITVRCKGHGYLFWWTPMDLHYDTQLVASTGDWTEYEFTAESAGIYKLQTCYTRIYDGGWGGQVDIQDRVVGILCDADRRCVRTFETPPSSRNGCTFWTAATTYFQVPDGTSHFIFGASYTGTTATLTPMAATASAVNYDYANGAESTISTPTTGTWKLEVAKSGMSQFYLIGVPPICWHDPEYLLVPTTKVAAPTAASTSITGNSVVCDTIVKLSAGDEIDAAATELQTYLQNMGAAGTVTITTSEIEGPAIRLQIGDWNYDWDAFEEGAIKYPSTYGTVQQRGNDTDTYSGAITRSGYSSYGTVQSKSDL